LWDECLNRQWFLSVDEVQVATERWRNFNIHVRPHSALGNLPPAKAADRPAQQEAA
jgi:transposase InsO family protein